MALLRQRGHMATSDAGYQPCCPSSGTGFGPVDPCPVTLLLGAGCQQGLNLWGARLAPGTARDGLA